METRDRIKKCFIAGLIAAMLLIPGCVTAPTQTATQPTTAANSQPQQTTSNLNNKPFTGTVILGRPTATSITMSLLTKVNTDIFIQYSTSPGRYESQTGVTKLQKDQPVEVKIGGLKIDTQYFYRVCHQTAGETEFSSADENTFQTQRAAGNSFVFTVDKDPH